MMKGIALIIICITLGQTEGAFNMGKRVHLHENFVVEERQWVEKIDANEANDAGAFEAQCQARYDELGDICPEGWEPHGEHLKVEVGGVWQSTILLNCGKVARCKSGY